MKCIVLASFLIATVVPAQEKPTNVERAVFKRYPAKHVSLPSKKPRAIIHKGDGSFRTRLRWIVDGEPNFNDHMRIEVWGCGTSCIIIGLADLRSGSTYLVPESLSTGGPGRRLAFDAHSKAVHMVGYFNEKRPADRWYLWDRKALRVIKETLLPERCFYPWEEAERLLPTAECNFQPPEDDQ